MQLRGALLDPQTYLHAQGHQVWQDSPRGDENAPLGLSGATQAWRSRLQGLEGVTRRVCGGGLGQAPELRGQGRDQPAIWEKGAAGSVSGPGPHPAEAMGALRGQLST